MREGIVFMEGEGMDRPSGAESFRNLPKIEGKVEVNVPDAPKSKIKDISSKRRMHEPPKTTTGSPLKSSYEAALERQKEPRESKPPKIEWTPTSQPEGEAPNGGPDFTPAPDLEEEEHEPKKEDPKGEEGAKGEEGEGRLESLLGKFEEGDKAGAYEITCQESGMDPDSPEAKEVFEKRWAAVEEAGKPHEQQDLDKLEDALKTMHPQEREAWRGILVKAGWDQYDIDKAFREASEVTPAPLSEEDGGGAGGVGAAPREGEEEGEAKIGATPLDKEVADLIADVDKSDLSTDDKIKAMMDWLKEHNGGPGQAAKDTLKVAYFLAITAIFAYIWALKTLGGGMSKAGGK